MSRIPDRPLTRNSPVRAIFDDRKCIGTVVKAGETFRAFGRRGRPLGTYDDVHQAADAVAEAAARESAP